MSIDLPSRATLTSIDLPLSRILDEVQSVMLDRFAKYGARNIAASPGGPLNGLRVRLHDKLARLNNAVDSGNTDFDDDSFRDCFIDVVGYGLIGLLVVDGNWPGVDGAPAVEKPLADLVDRDAVAQILLGKPNGETHRWSELGVSSRSDLEDYWPDGTTFRGDTGSWTWTRHPDGWLSSSPAGWLHEPVKHRTLSAVVSDYQYPDGTITRPSNTLQKEAA